ncbi:MAG: hypothetical protein RLZZ59_127 [Pseudomonadota bacterium]|jgi:cation diffusion facilitator family transporter
MGHSHIHTEENLAILKSAPYASVGVALVICFIKTYCWTQTESSSVFASLIDSILDISASLINLIALRMALAPPDNEHRFGHDKIEDLAVFGQSVMISISGLFAFYISFKNLLTSHNASYPDIGIAGLVLSSILTVFLLMYQSFVIKKTKSRIVTADKLHYLSDLFTNIVVIGSLYLSNKILFLDSVVGMLIAAYVIHSSYQLLLSAIKNLVDEEFSAEDRRKVLDLIATRPEIQGVHDMKTRFAGSKPFIQFHLEMDGEMTLNAAHKISDAIMHDIKKAFHGAEVIIHQDPDGPEPDIEYREKLR